MKMTLSKHFDNFIYEKSLACLSDKTISSYQFQLRGFLQFLGLDCIASNLTRNDFDRYVLFLKNRKLSKGTLHSYVRSVKIFLTYISEHDCLSFAPSDISVPKSPKKKPKIYTDDEVRLIFGSIHNDIEWLEYRDKAIISLMYDSGLRQMEVCNLLLPDIQFNESRMLVHGKGDKDRYVPLGKVSALFLKHYLELCPFPIVDNVFCGLDGSVLSRNAVKLMVSRIRRHLPFELSSHKLRHNFATNYAVDQLERFGHIDSLSLQAIMGHESLQTTQQYLHYAQSICAVRSSRSHLDSIDMSIK